MGSAGEQLSPEVVASYYAELGAYERHFNEMQSRYRALASTWLLAAIAAIGFILTRRLSVHIDPALLIAAISFAAGCGVALLWNLDLLVYHRLLHAVFRAGLELDATYPNTPQIRQAMDAATDDKGVNKYVVYYYLVTTGALFLVAILAFEVWASEAIGDWALLTGALLVAVASGALLLLKQASCRVDSPVS